MRFCSISTCDRRYYGNGYCDAHNQRFKKYGDPLEDKPLRSRYRLFPDYAKPVCYGTAHVRCRRLWGAADQYACIECNEPAQDWAYDGTDLTELYDNRGPCKSAYSLYPEFYMPMCRKCHKNRDQTLLWRDVEEYRAIKQGTGLDFANLCERLGIRR